MSTRRIWAVAAALAITALAGAGCGDDDDDASGDDAAPSQEETSTTTTTAPAVRDGGTASRDEYVDALAAGDEDSDLTVEQGLCVYGAFVDGYGADALAAAGVTPDDLLAADDPADVGIEFSDEQAEAFYQGMSGCIDVRALVVGGMTEESGPEEAACIEANMTDDLVKQFVIVAFTEGEAAMESDPELTDAIVAALEPCLAADGT